MNYPPTIIVRHRRENLKKCSLRGLEKRADFCFFTYPDCIQGKQSLPPLENYMALDLEGPPLSKADAHLGLVLLDATWRLAGKMNSQIVPLQKVIRRSIPQGFQTAYPRRQEDCLDPNAGLASIEALYIAYHILGRNCEGLLDAYHWRELFFTKNGPILLRISQENSII